jgi:hypothetical protein
LLARETNCLIAPCLSGDWRLDNDPDDVDDHLDHDEAARNRDARNGRREPGVALRRKDPRDAVGLGDDGGVADGVAEANAEAHDAAVLGRRLGHNGKGCREGQEGAEQEHEALIGEKGVTFENCQTCPEK